jgi:tetratricopeptide (TPR) repeat protein
MRIFIGIGLVTLLSVASFAEEGWSWPEKPQNLQVLPKDWPGSRLEAPMTGFARALGVRCSHCHVGEPGAPLTTYDFASDQNPNKERAREMLRMLGSINGHLDKIEPSGGEPVNMWCHTCHRGRPRPMVLSEELAEAYRTHGVGQALIHYSTLRRDFYGKGAYDFTDEGALNGFGYQVLADGDPEGAVKVFQLNAEFFPESANAWDSLAEAYQNAGDLGRAKELYLKSLELNSENQNAEQQLERIEAELGRTNRDPAAVDG